MPAKTAFDNHCNCGGFAYSMNDRNPEQPHMHWCPQFSEYAEWWKETHEAKGNANTK